MPQNKMNSGFQSIQLHSTALSDVKDGEHVSPEIHLPPIIDVIEKTEQSVTSKSEVLDGGNKIDEDIPNYVESEE